MADYNLEFGDAVRKALGKRSYRQVAPRVGVSPSYIGDMVQGRVPGREVVIAFADATETEVDALLLCAGYAPENRDLMKTPGEQLFDTAESHPQELTYEDDLSNLRIEGFGGAENISPEDVETVTRIARSLLSEKRRRQRRE